MREGKSLIKKAVLFAFAIGVALCGLFSVGCASGITLKNAPDVLETLKVVGGSEKEVVVLSATVEKYSEQTVTEFGFLLKTETNTEGYLVKADRIDENGDFQLVLYGIEQGDYSATAYAKDGDGKIFYAPDPVGFSIDKYFGTKLDLQIESYQSDCTLGEVTVPKATLSVFDTGEPVTERSVDISAAFNGNPVEIKDGKFTFTDLGMLEVSYKSGGYLATANFFVREKVLKTYEDGAFFTTDATVTTAKLHSWCGGPLGGTTFDNCIVFYNQRETYNVTFDLGVSVDEIKANYDRLEFEITVFDMGFGVVFGGQSVVGNKVRTASVNAREWNGSVELRATHADWEMPLPENSGLANKKCYIIAINKVTARTEGDLSVGNEYKAVVGKNIELEDATFTFASYQKRVAPSSAKFNGEDVELDHVLSENGVKTAPLCFNETGVLEVKYSYLGFEKKIEVEVNPVREIVVARYLSKAALNKAFTIPGAVLTDNETGNEVADVHIERWAEFDGYSANISSGTYTATKAGKLKITYACGTLRKTVEVDFGSQFELQCKSQDFNGAKKTWAPYAGQELQNAITFNNLASKRVYIDFDGLTVEDIRNNFNEITFVVVTETLGCGLEFNWDPSVNYVTPLDQTPTEIVVYASEWFGYFDLVPAHGTKGHRETWSNNISNEGAIDHGNIAVFVKAILK